MNKEDEELISSVIANDAAFEMSTVQTKRSHLPYRVWLDDIGKRRSVGHNPYRLKYGPDYNNCVEVPFKPQMLVYDYIGHLDKGVPDMASLSRWINLNYDNLVRFYDDEDYDFVDFIFDMKAVDTDY